MPLPDLASYSPHRTVLNAAFEGAGVPGLRVEFFHRSEGERTASVGRYSLGGRYLLMTWGWTDEMHCSWSSVRDPAGFWHPERPGRPVVRILRAGPGPDAPVTGMAVRAPSGEWVTAGRDPVPVR